MKNILKFIKDNDLELKVDGEIGFGRSCVGIINPKTNCYIGYQSCLDDEDYTPTNISKHVAPNAYHKDDFLAVLTDEVSEDEAIKQLDSWVEKIMVSGYQVADKMETNTMTALLAGGAIAQKEIRDV